MGTSATIKSIDEEGHSRDEVIRLRDEAVQEFFSKLTGATPHTIRVLGEELEDVQVPPEAGYPAHPATIGPIDVSDPDTVRRALCALAGQPPETSIDRAARRCRLLWDLNRWLIGAPMSVRQLVAQLQAEVQERKEASASDIRAEIESGLIIGAALPDDVPGTLRLRVHRLIRGG